MSLRVQPITQAEAFRFVNDYHHHHDEPTGWLFGTAVAAESGGGCGELRESSSWVGR